MNIYQLQYFRTMAKMQHYTQASKVLCVTQPTLSNAISALEEELGTSLFEKQGRNVVLSQHGKLFLTYIERALDELKAGTDKVKELAGNLQAPVNIGFIYTLSSSFIPGLIAGSRKDKEHADLAFTLYEATTINECTPGLVKNLKSGNLDLIFVSLPPKDADIEFVPICEQELVAILPCDSPIAGSASIDLRDVEPYPLIHYSGKSGLQREINRMFEKVNITPKVCCEVEDELTIAGLVAANIGIAIVPDSPNFRAFRIKVLPISNPVHKRVIYLGYMKNRAESSSIQHFKEYAIKHAREIMNAELGSM